MFEKLSQFDMFLQARLTTTRANPHQPLPKIYALTYSSFYTIDLEDKQGKEATIEIDRNILQPHFTANLAG